MDEFDVRSVERISDRIWRGRSGRPGLEDKWVGLDVSDDVIGQLELADDVVRLIGRKLSLSAIKSSIGKLFLGTIMPGDARFYSRRLAANLDYLIRGKPVPEWVGLEVDTHLLSPLQIVGTAPGWSRGKVSRRGVTLTYRVLFGRACPAVFSRWCSNGFVWVLGKKLGISNYRARINKFDGKHTSLFGMRLIGDLRSSSFRTDDRAVITYDRFAGGQFERYNQRLLRLRHQPCPLKFSYSCSNCNLGVDDCPVKLPVRRACRPETLVSEWCPACGASTWHDAVRCLECLLRPPSVRDAKSDEDAEKARSLERT